MSDDNSDSNRGLVKFNAWWLAAAILVLAVIAALVLVLTFGGRDKPRRGHLAIRRTVDTVRAAGRGRVDSARDRGCLRPALGIRHPHGRTRRRVGQPHGTAHPHVE